MINVRFLDNSGEGRSRWIEVADGTRLEAFLVDQLDKDVEDIEDGFTVKLNRESAPLSAVLNEGDLITAAPRKIEGQ